MLRVKPLSGTGKVSKIKVYIDTLEDLPQLHETVQDFIDNGWSSEDRILCDNDKEWFEILVK